MQDKIHVDLDEYTKMFFLTKVMERWVSLALNFIANFYGIEKGRHAATAVAVCRRLLTVAEAVFAFDGAALARARVRIVVQRGQIFRPPPQPP